MVYFSTEVGVAGRPKTHLKAARERSPRRLLSGPYRHDDISAKHAKRDLEEYCLPAFKMVPEHYVSGGYTVVVKTTQETAFDGDSIHIFVWADNKAMAINRALRYLPERIKANAVNYMVTAISAGRVDPETKQGIVPCRNR